MKLSISTVQQHISEIIVPVCLFTHQVMQSLRFALQPAVVDISVKWDLPKGLSATVLSPPITTLFQGQRSLIYAQLTGKVGAAPSHSEAMTSSSLNCFYLVSSSTINNSEAGSQFCFILLYILTLGRLLYMYMSFYTLTFHL